MANTNKNQAGRHHIVQNGGNTLMPIQAGYCPGQGQGGFSPPFFPQPEPHPLSTASKKPAPGRSTWVPPTTTGPCSPSGKTQLQAGSAAQT